MDLTEILADIALDLKITLDSEVSTALATRAVNRAVDVMSRKIPRERIYEHTWRKEVTDDSFAIPAAADPDRFVDNMDISASVDGDTATLTSTLIPTTPRPVTVTFTDANLSITRFTLIVKGIDVEGVYHEERFYRHNGLSQTGKVYFSAIQEVEINEIAGNGAGDVLDVGITDGIGYWINLSNPVDSGSDGIYSATGKGGTKYTKDTDYEIDYHNGRIRALSGGSLAAGTTYYANYDRSPVSINISEIVPELIRISKVKYPETKIPEQYPGFNIWGNILTITSQRQGQSQQSFQDGEHVTIMYEARHAPPTPYASGSYPELLDDIVKIGACGYILETLAVQYELAAVIDLASMRTELGYTTIVHTAVGTALGKASSMLSLTTGEIDIALDKVATYLENNGGNDAKSILTQITTQVAELRTKIWTAQDAIATTLGNVSSLSLDLATYGAADLVETGVPTINVVNTGGQAVPSHYSDYAKTQANIAQIRVLSAAQYATEVNGRLSTLASYISESGGWNNIANTFVAEAQVRVSTVQGAIAEANSRLAEIDRYLTEADSYRQAAEGNMILSDRFRAEGQTRIAEFNRLLNTKSEYRKRVSTTPTRQPA